MAITLTDSALIRLMQLSSASLPVGAYAFSQGLESAVENGWITNLDETEAWLNTQIEFSLVRVDLPIIFRVRKALDLQDMTGVNYWNAFLFACRETKELHLTDEATGTALKRLLKQLGLDDLVKDLKTPSFLTVFCAAAKHWEISEEACCLGYLWSWLENQVAAATKLVPLGQTDAQILLGRLQATLPEYIESATEISDENIGSSLPALAIASAQHETQYSRLFRS
ncbi:MAG: urease accessory protein UreF [Agarilytica sp.]